MERGGKECVVELAPMTQARIDAPVVFRKEFCCETNTSTMDSPISLSNRC